MRKRRGLDSPVDAFIHHVCVVSFFVGHLAVCDFVAFRDTDASALSRPARVDSTVIDGGARAVYVCVVLPAY